MAQLEILFLGVRWCIMISAFSKNRKSVQNILWNAQLERYITSSGVGRVLFFFCNVTIADWYNLVSNHSQCVIFTPSLSARIPMCAIAAIIYQSRMNFGSRCSHESHQQTKRITMPRQITQFWCIEFWECCGNVFGERHICTLGSEHYQHCHRLSCL